MPDRAHQFALLYSEHGRAVRSVVARLAGPGMDVEDLCHEVFVVAWRKLPGLDEVAGRGWLCAVALKVVAGARRRARLRRWVGLDAVAALPASGTPADAFERREASQLVYEALDHLSEKKRTVFILHELQGLTGEQIASILRCPPKTVWSRLGHARREFEHHLRRQAAQETVCLGETP